MNPISRLLVVTLSEVKESLRIDDSFTTALSMPSVPNSTTHTIQDLGTLKTGNWVTVENVDTRISAIDYAEKIIMLTEPVSEFQLSTGTPVSYHFQNTMLMNLIEAAKSELDIFLGNDFIVGYEQVILEAQVVTVPLVRIPPEVKRWILGKVALDYSKPEATVGSVSIREVGSTRYRGWMFDDGGLYGGIEHLRKIPL